MTCLAGFESRLCTRETDKGLVIRVPSNKTSHCQLRWLGCTWIGKTSDGQAGEWYCPEDGQTVALVQSLYPHLNFPAKAANRAIWWLLKLSADRLPEIGYTLSPLTVARGDEPSFEEIRTWPGGDAMAEWLQRIKGGRT